MGWEAVTGPRVPWPDPVTCEVLLLLGKKNFPQRENKLGFEVKPTLIRFLTNPRPHPYPPKSYQLSYHRDGSPRPLGGSSLPLSWGVGVVSRDGLGGPPGVSYVYMTQCAKVTYCGCITF